MQINTSQLSASIITFSDNSENAEPLVSADTIAKLVGITHRSISKTINRNKNYLKNIQREFEAHGRINYLLNEKQCILLVNILRTTELTKQLRTQLLDILIKQFNNALKNQSQRQLVHEKSKPLSIDLGKAIKDSPYTDSHSYVNFNNLVYKTALHMTTKQLRHDRCIPKNKSISEYLSVNEQRLINKIKSDIKTFLKYGYDYQSIKDAIQYQEVAQIGA